MSDAQATVEASDMGAVLGGDWVAEADWLRHDLHKRNGGKTLIFDIYTFKFKRPAKEIRAK